MTSPNPCVAVPAHDPSFVRYGRCTVCFPDGAAGSPAPVATRPADPFIWYEEPRPGRVTAAAVLLLVLGGLAVLGSLALVVGGEVAGVLILVLLVGGFEIWIGVALLLRQAWARTAGRAVGMIGVLLSGFSLLLGNALSVIGLGIYIAVVALLFGDSVRN